MSDDGFLLCYVMCVLPDRLPAWGPFPFLRPSLLRTAANQNWHIPSGTCSFCSCRSGCYQRFRVCALCFPDCFFLVDRGRCFRFFFLRTGVAVLAPVPAASLAPVIVATGDIAVVPSPRPAVAVVDPALPASAVARPSVASAATASVAAAAAPTDSAFVLVIS